MTSSRGSASSSASRSRRTSARRGSTTRSRSSTSGQTLNASLTYRDRTYLPGQGLAGDWRVLEDARLWMPREATYRVVEEPGVGQETQRYARFFLLGLLLPRRQVDSAKAEYAFCYGCTLRDARAAVPGSLEVVRRPLRAAPLVTPRALVGLAVLNVFFLVVGAGVLWGIRGWRCWTELVRLAGLAYLLGLASLMVLMTVRADRRHPGDCGDRPARRRVVRRGGHRLSRISRRDVASPRTGGLAVPATVGVRRAVPGRDRRLPRGDVPVGAARRRRERVRQLGLLDAEGGVDLLLRAPRPPTSSRSSRTARIRRAVRAPGCGVPLHGVGGHDVLAYAVLVPRRGVRCGGCGAARRAGPRDDPRPRPACRPRRSEPRRARDDDVRGRPARLPRRRFRAARCLVGRAA